MPGRLSPLIKLIFALSLFAVELALSACSDEMPGFATREPNRITLTVDGGTHNLTTEASNVRELLEEAGVDVSVSDIVQPPPFTPLKDDMEITIVRVSESIEVIEQVIPYQRRTVRNESMRADDPPMVVQSGQPGLQEVTVRIVYHNGLEFSRQETKTLIVEPAQDEIIMVGISAAATSVDFPGVLAFIDGGNSVIMRGSTLFPQQIATGSDLDRRVFSLSPAGTHLLYTKAISETERFNSLWVVGTERGAEPRSLEVDNVLWAAWNPDPTSGLQIAYTTGVASSLFPGWEANNDLWLANISLDEDSDLDGEQVVESYPATYGWWGGNYAWSPNGRYIAFGYADEIGLIDVQIVGDGEPDRRQLKSFTEYNTRADWVWVPSLSWSPDGEYLAFVEHASDDPEEISFDTRVIGIETEIANTFVENSGIWSHPRWSTSRSPDQDQPLGEETHLAVLRATNPQDSLRSSYTLWLMDRDGSNARQFYPPVGENSRFPRDSSFLAWSPEGGYMAFVYDGALYIVDMESSTARKITQDDSVASNPTWALFEEAELTEDAEAGGDIEPTPEIFRRDDIIRE